MTTEVVLMNRSAAAMAADSAVTISGDSGLKVYDSVNKLFELVKGRPVGVMIYNWAELAMIPLETIIKTYREDRCRVDFSTVDEYANDLLSYLTESRRLFPAEQQEQALLSNMVNVAVRLRSEISWRIQRSLGQRVKPTDRQIGAIVREVLEAFVAEIKDRENGPWSSHFSETTFVRDWRNHSRAVIDMVFQELPISKRLRQQFERSLLLLHLRSGDDYYAGIVITGFGRDEFYPRMREFKVRGILDNVLLVEEGKTEEISATNTASVIPFAQGDMVRSFTDGIQDQVRGAIANYWATWADGVRKRSLEAIHKTANSVSEAEAKTLAGAFGQMAKDGVTEFMEAMSHFEADQVRGPILQSLAYLPKDEMGAMAESLVSLTTLKRRVSIRDAQTVGGAVDVAVVSKGDGFVWLERKHYFDLQLNPTWATLHTGHRAMVEGADGQ